MSKSSVVVANPMYVPLWRPNLKNEVIKVKEIFGDFALASGIQTLGDGETVQFYTIFDRKGVYNAAGVTDWSLWRDLKVGMNVRVYAVHYGEENAWNLKYMTTAVRFSAENNIPPLLPEVVPFYENASQIVDTKKFEIFNQVARARVLNRTPPTLSINPVASPTSDCANSKPTAVDFKLAMSNILRQDQSERIQVLEEKLSNVTTRQRQARNRESAKDAILRDMRKEINLLKNRVGELSGATPLVRPAPEVIDSPDDLFDHEMAYA